jgi:two-component system, NtrC family, response regulator HydG
MTDAVNPVWSLLLISDEEQFLSGIAPLFPPEEFRIAGFVSCGEALPHLRGEAFHLLILSRAHIGAEEERLLNAAMEADEGIPVFLFLDRREEIEAVRHLIRPTTWSILLRPQPLEHLKVLIQNALDRIRLQGEVNYLRHTQPYIHGFQRIVGRSPQIQNVLRLLQRIAPSDATVLIQGESGTGKELIAAAVHYNSLRKTAPFVAVNCAALHENLLESELFGHEKGAFTGADRQRIGRFEQANGGTLFLDEVGDMSPNVQAKALRVLQERCFERLGGSKTVRVNVRIIAATNQDLRRAIRERRFREDLFYRLSVVPVHLPPLRDRPDDILPLAEFFLEKFSGPDRGHIQGFHPDARGSLVSHPWPGNVRELENVVERAVLVAQGPFVRAQDLLLPVPVSTDAPPTHVHLPPGGVRLEDVERDLILQALERTHGVQRKAARLLGISPRAIHYKIRKHSIHIRDREG